MRKVFRLFTVTTLMLCMFTSTCFAGTLDKNTSTGSTAVKIDVTKTDPDKNGDGKITADDFTDTNGDGVIDAEDGFIDTNGDGEMTPEDFEEGSGEGGSVGDLNGDGVVDEKDQEIFDNIDTNGDGEITDEDFEGGSLPAGSFDYTVTVPTAMTLSVENGATSLTADTSFGQIGKVTIKGSAGANKHVSISVTSGTTGDTGCDFTLVKSDDVNSKTTGGTFYIGSIGQNTYAAASDADKTAMLSSTGLVKDLVVTGVKGVTEFGVYNGSLVYTISVVSE